MASNENHIPPHPNFTFKKRHKNEISVQKGPAIWSDDPKKTKNPSKANRCKHISFPPSKPQQIRKSFRPGHNPMIQEYMAERTSQEKETLKNQYSRKQPRGNSENQGMRLKQVAAFSIQHHHRGQTRGVRAFFPIRKIETRYRLVKKDAKQSNRRRRRSQQKSYVALQNESRKGF